MGEASKAALNDRPTVGAILPEATPEDLFSRLPEDREARDALIRRYRPLAARVATRYVGPGEELEDLVQVAMVGLIKSVDRFEPARGVPFAAFARVTINGEVKRHFRDATWSMGVSQGAKEAALRTRSVLGDAAQALGRTPSPGEVAARANLSEREVLEHLRALASYRPFSLEAAMDEEGSLLGRAREPAEEDRGLHLAEEWADLAPHLRRLPERDRRVLVLRYGGGLTQAEIGRSEGVSQMTVSRILRRVVERLRGALA